MYQGVSDLAIAVTDIKATKDFYETVGFDVEPNTEQDARVFPAEDSAYIYVYETENDESLERDTDYFSNPIGIDHFSIGVDDVEDVHETLTERGIEFELPPSDVGDSGLRAAAVKDPDGTIIYFIRWT